MLRPYQRPSPTSVELELAYAVLAGPVNGITIKEYHEVVHWGWYVVKATLVETYEIYYKDKDEQGFEAWYCKVRKECHEKKAMVKRSHIRHALAARRERLYAKVAAIIDFISPAIQALLKRLPPDCGIRVLQCLVHADDFDPAIVQRILEGGFLQTPPPSASPRWLRMRQKRLEARWERNRSVWKGLQ